MDIELEDNRRHIQMECQKAIICDKNDVKLELSERVMNSPEECVGSDEEFDPNYESKRKSKTNVNRISGRLKKNIDSNSTERPVFECDFSDCKQLFRTEHKFYIHLKRVHTKCQKPFICDRNGCDFRAKTLTLLKKHSISHSNNKSIKCDFIGCDRSFKTKQLMRQHFKHFHTIYGKPFVCDYTNCEFRAKSKSHLNDHKSKHSTHRPFECRVSGCDYAAKTSRDLRKHDLNMHKRPEISCTSDGCTFATRTIPQLSKHMVSVHLISYIEPISDREFACDWPGCDHRSALRANLTRHKYVHKSELDFGCLWPECGKAFKSHKLLSCHMRIHSNKRRYRCEWPGCEYSSVDKANVNQHRNRKHLKNK